MDVKRTKTPEQALRTLMDLCAKSEKSGGDARRLLARWGVEPEQREEIVQRLVREKFIDDSRYAEAYVRDKINLSRWGVYKIRAGLRAKQIPDEVIDAALRQADAGTMRGRLAGLLENRMKTVRAKNSYELRGKLLRYGAGLGFDYQDVVDAVDRLVREEW